MNRPVAVGLVVLVLAVAGLSVPVAAVGGGASGAAEFQSSTHAADVPPTSVAATDEPGSQDFDSKTFEITVHEDGSATWTFEYIRSLENEAEEDQFENVSETYESEETALHDRFVRMAESMVETGENATDREMEATDFERSAGIEHRPGPTGVIEMTFTWHGFGDTDGDTVDVGDVFQNWYILSDQSIEIAPGENLVIADASPEGTYHADTIENASDVAWNGDRQFRDGQPSVTLADPDDLNGDGGGGVDLQSWLDGVGDLPWFVVAGLVVALGLVLGVAFARLRGSDSGDEARGGTDSDPSSGDGSTAADSGAAGASASDPLSDEELLTDEDRVIELIRENGGRMKQVNIVEETGWSKSKVSMLLSEMEEEGTISKLRVGRENIISLEGFEPEATKSPFED